MHRGRPENLGREDAPWNRYRLRIRQTQFSLKLYLTLGGKGDVHCVAIPSYHMSVPTPATKDSDLAVSFSILS